MALCTLQGWSGEEAGAPCCPAGPICLTRSGCFDTTWGFPSLNWHASNGCIPALTQSTTRSSKPLPAIEIAPGVLRYQSRRDFLVFGAGALAAVAGTGFLLPPGTLSRLGLGRN